MPSGPDHLATHIVRARVRLYRSRREFAQAAGIGKRTVDKLETGEPSEYRPSTITAVEDGLYWEPGSFLDVLSGGSPSPKRDEHLDRLLAAWPHLSMDARRILADLAERSEL